MKYQITTVQQNYKRYLDKFFKKEFQSWLKVLRFYWLFVFLGSVAAIVFAIYINPFAPKTVFLATGQQGSSYTKISDEFQIFFKKNGIKLDLVPTSGLGEGLKGLDSVTSDISASFMTAGVVSGKEYPNLVSLGSVQYAPIWIFYRGDTVRTNDPFEYFSDKKINIGPSENVTNRIFKSLYRLNQQVNPSVNNFSELSFKEAAAQLISGQLDAVFIVDNYQSETIQRLLNAKDIKIMNFPLADAYLKKHPFLRKLVIPKGSINLDTVHPSEDITILSSTTTLLVEKDMHPAIQWAYLLSAKEFGSNASTFFADAGYFPRNLDQSFPLSPIAKRFYEQGTPSIFSFLPIWMASLIENIWAYVLAFFVIILPAFGLLATTRMFAAEQLMNQMFINLRELDEAISEASNKEQIQDIINAIIRYESEVQANWLFGKNSRFYFNQKNALAGIKRDALAKQATLTE